MQVNEKVTNHIRYLQVLVVPCKFQLADELLAEIHCLGTLYTVPIAFTDFIKVYYMTEQYQKRQSTKWCKSHHV